MSALVKSPIDATLAAPSYSEAPETVDSEAVIETFFATVLSRSRYVIQLERWIDNEIYSTKFFAQVSKKGSEESYLQIGKDVVWKDWVWKWEYIKIKCSHENVFFVLKMLERAEVTGEKAKQIKRRKPAGKTEQKIHIEDASKEDSVDRGGQWIKWQARRKRGKRGKALAGLKSENADSLRNWEERSGSETHDELSEEFAGDNTCDEANEKSADDASEEMADD